MKAYLALVVLKIATLLTVLWLSHVATVAQSPTDREELRVSIGGKVVHNSSVPLEPGATAQLRVELVSPDRTTADVTKDARTQYFVLSLDTLSVSDTGLLRAFPARGPGRYDKLGLIGITYQVSSTKDPLMALVSFEIKAPPGVNDLHVIAPRTTLRPGETVQLTVLHKAGDGTVRDLTSAASGTRYVTTSESVLVPEPDGRVTCVGARDRPQERETILAFNAKRTGQVTFDVLPGGPGPTLTVSADRTTLAEGERTRL